MSPFAIFAISMSSNFQHIILVCNHPGVKTKSENILAKCFDVKTSTKIRELGLLNLDPKEPTKNIMCAFIHQVYKNHVNVNLISD